MHFYNSDRILRQCVLVFGELAARQIIVVRGEQPDSSVGIQNPASPPPGIAKFRLEGSLFCRGESLQCFHAPSDRIIKVSKRRFGQRTVQWAVGITQLFWLSGLLP